VRTLRGKFGRVADVRQILSEQSHYFGMKILLDLLNIKAVVNVEKTAVLYREKRYNKCYIDTLDLHK
jgi:hypothetical protein